MGLLTWLAVNQYISTRLAPQVFHLPNPMQLEELGTKVGEIQQALVNQEQTKPERA